MTTKSEIGQLLKNRGIKKSKLAHHLGMSRQGLEYHIKGEEPIDGEVHKKILEFLGGKKVSEPTLEYGSDRVSELEKLVTTLVEKTINLEKENIQLKEKIENLSVENAQLLEVSESYKKIKNK